MGRIKISKEELGKLIQEHVDEVLTQEAQTVEENPFADELRNLNYLSERLEVYAQTIKEDYIPAIEGKFQSGVEALNTVLGEGAYSVVGTDTDYDNEIRVSFKINSYEGFKKHIMNGNYKCVRYAIEDTASEEGIDDITNENYKMLLDKTLSDAYTLADLLDDVLNENLYGETRGAISSSFETSADGGACVLEIELPFNISNLRSFIEGGD